jgi:predicted transcriptional regulator
MFPLVEEIGRRRRLLGLNQKELANLSGVSQSMIAKIEGGRINPSYLKTKAVFDTLEDLETQHGLKAKDICKRKVVGVETYDTVSNAIRVMRETGFSQLPVFDKDQTVGSLTEKIILEKLVSSTGKEVSNQAVERIMEDSFPTVGGDTPISMVSTLLNYGYAVIVSDKGRVTGIITKADLLKALG